MEKIDILLSSKKSKNSNSESSYINLSLDTNQRLLPPSNIEGDVDEYDEYLQDKELCTKFNLSFSVNTVCSNILSNNISEIVYKEGSDDCIFVGSSDVTTYKDTDVRKVNRVNDYLKYKGLSKDSSFKLSREEMIKDTSYSHSEIGPFVYHCGYDIFSNHLLRSNSFTMINPLASSLTDSQKKMFNTIGDYSRLHDGTILTDEVGGITVNDGKIDLNVVSDGTNEYLKKETQNIHEYEYSMIDTFKETIQSKLIETDGWFGFTNPTTLEIENCTLVSGDSETKISINRCMNNNKACEQIDLYPDRTLFSMIPKYNKYKNRTENNWEFCLTYPFKNYYDSELVEVDVDGDKINGLECEIASKMTDIFETDYVETSDGGELLIYDSSDSTKTKSQLKENTTILFKTTVNHNLTIGDLVRITMIEYDDDGNASGYTEIENDIQVVGVGYDNDYYDNFFSINSPELSDVLDADDLLVYMPDGTDGNKYFYFDSNRFKFRFAKISNNTISQYYIRLFRRFPNFNNTNVYSDGEVSEDEIKEHMFDDFYHSVNKLAFANNAFGDGMAQIYYGEDIDTNSITDNLGRYVTQLYLTIVKSNKGHEDWYHNKKYHDYEDESGNTHEIDFSHCFGKITSGFDFPTYVDEYNIHKIHNIDISALDKLVESNEADNAISRFVNDYLQIEDSPNSFGGEVTISGDTSLYDEYGEGVFYGDIVEFCPTLVQEETLENIYFRFNTEQREYTEDKEFYNIKFDTIKNDDYTLSEDNLYESYEIETEYLNIYDSDTTKVMSDNKYLYAQKYPGNINPEGYYYNPHYKVQLKEFSNTISQGSHQKLYYTAPSGITSAYTFSLKYGDSTIDLSVSKLNTEYNLLNVLGSKVYGKSLWVTEDTTVTLEKSDDFGDLIFIKFENVHTGSSTKTGFATKSCDLISGGTDGTYPICIEKGEMKSGHILIADKLSKDNIWSKSMLDMMANAKYEETAIGEYGDEFIIRTPKDYFIYEGTNLYAFNKETLERETCKVMKVTGTKVKYITIKFSDSVTFKTLLSDGTYYYNYSLFKINIYKPYQAIDLLDGTGRFLWRKEKTEAEYRQTDELYDRTFTNGKIYLHNQINLYLRRQDPFGDNGLSFSAKENLPTSVKSITKYGEYTDIDNFEVSEENEANTHSCGFTLSDEINNTVNTVLAIQKDDQLKNTAKKFQNMGEKLVKIKDAFKGDS